MSDTLPAGTMSAGRIGEACSPTIHQIEILPVECFPRLHKSGENSSRKGVI